MTLNVAVLGTGWIAEDHLVPAIIQQEGARLWSVLSRDPERAAVFAKQHGAHAPHSGHSELDRLLADPELDAVVIATPDKLHAAQTIAAARAGKHVFVEKPMATDRESARAMVDACAKAGVKLGVAYHMRWHAGHRRLARMVHDGELGKVRHMRAQWCWRASSAEDWRASEDVGRWWSLGGVGTHCLDQIRWFMRPQCGEVAALKSLVNRSVWNGPHDETAVLAMQFESGATAELCSSVLFDGPRRLELYASDGYFTCEDTFGPTGGGEIRTDKGVQSFGRVDPYVGEIADFLDAIRDDRPPEVDGVEGMRNIELLLDAVEQCPA